MLAALALGSTCSAAPAEEAPSLTVALTEEHGRYLVGPAGLPVYAFHTDVRAGDNTPPLQSCKERCREDWPVVTVAGEATVAEGLEPGLATFLREDDGKRVLVYDSQPLFYFHADTRADDPQGHGIHTYGGWWYLVSPSGAPIVTGIMPVPEGYD